MRLRRTLTLLLLLPLHATAAELPEFQALYNFERGRVTIGETRISLERSQGDIWRYASKSEATGFVSLFVDDVIREESIFRFEDGEFWPVSYEYEQENSSKNRDERVVYDWTDRIAQVNYRGHESQPELEPGMLDRFLLQLAITAHSRNGALDRTYRVIDNGRVLTFQLKSQGMENVQTPAGNFQALRVERVDRDSDKKLRLWLAPDLDYLPVRIEQEQRNEETLRLVLKRFQRSIAGTAPATG